MKYLFLIFYFFGTITLIGQHNNSILEIPKNSFSQPLVLDSDENQILILKNKQDKNNLVLRGLDRNTKKEKFVFNLKKELKLNKVHTNAPTVKGNVILISYLVEDMKVGNLFNLFVLEIDKKTGNIITNEKIDTIEATANNLYVNYLCSPDFNYTILSINYLDVRNRNYYNHKWLLNASNELQISKIEKNTNEIELDTWGHKLLNTGDLCMLQRIGNDIFLTSYNLDDEYNVWRERIDLSELDMDLDTRMSHIQLTLSESKQLNIIGQYQSNSSVKGLCMITIDEESKEIMQYKLLPFDKSINSYLSEINYDETSLKVISQPHQPLTAIIGLANETHLSDLLFVSTNTNSISLNTHLMKRSVKKTKHNNISVNSFFSTTYTDNELLVHVLESKSNLSVSDKYKALKPKENAHIRSYHYDYTTRKIQNEVFTPSQNTTNQPILLDSHKNPIVVDLHW